MTSREDLIFQYPLKILDREYKFTGDTSSDDDGTFYTFATRGRDHERDEVLVRKDEINKFVLDRENKFLVPPRSTTWW